LATEKQTKISIIKRIAERYVIDRNDAAVIFYIKTTLSRYDRFCIDVLGIEKSRDDSYDIQIPSNQYFVEKGKVAKELQKLDFKLRDAHPEMSATFSPEIAEFRNKIVALPPKGHKDTINELRVNLELFKMKLIDIIGSGNTDKFMDTYVKDNEERARQVWTQGLKKLAKFPNARILLSLLLTKCHHIPMNKRAISVEINQTEAWIEKHMMEIMENAPELLGLGSDGNHTTYHVPRIFGKFDFSKGDS